MIFKESFRGVSRKFQRCLKENFKKVFEVFQEISGPKSACGPKYFMVQSPSLKKENKSNNKSINLPIFNVNMPKITLLFVFHF